MLEGGAITGKKTERGGREREREGEEGMERGKGNPHESAASPFPYPPTLSLAKRHKPFTRRPLTRLPKMQARQRQAQ